MAYDRYDRPRDERFRNTERYRGGRDEDRGERGFFERAGDEISSWFGDEEAERRREQDDRMSGYGRQDDGRSGYGRDDVRSDRGRWFGADRDDDRSWRSSEWNRDRGEPYRGQDRSQDRGQDRGRRDYGGQGYSRAQSEEYRTFAGDYGRGSSERYSAPRGVGAGSAFARAATTTSRSHDPHYEEWRQRQIDQLDQDYEEYRREHQSKFDNDFSGWRSQRRS